MEGGKSRNQHNKKQTSDKNSSINLKVHSLKEPTLQTPDETYQYKKEDTNCKTRM